MVFAAPNCGTCEPPGSATKRDAEIWLASTEVEIRSDRWLDPDAGAISFGTYADAWIIERPGLRPKTVGLYRYLLRRLLLPSFGNCAIADIREPMVRRWRRELLTDEVSEVTLAKAYRLLKAILNTAVDDQLISRNPCRIKGAGQERSPERPVLTVAQVFALAEAIDQRYRAAVLLASFGSLRWGELAALRRMDIDLDVRVVRITRQLTEARGAGLLFAAPKTDAGRRIVAIPEVIVAELRWHLACFVADGDEGLVFTSADGTLLRHSNFRNRVWLGAVEKAGLVDLHFHDLRHAGNQLAAGTGATLRELMDRMGHSTTRAALIYLHGSDQRQHEIAQALSNLAEAELKGPEKSEQGRAPRKSSGTQRAPGKRTAS
ncbi:MAG: tyrosine-type recombinase/integrase [Streptosporangiaceae bacterium]|jgi:integrase